MKRLDFIIITAIILIAAALYFSGILKPGESGGYAVIYVDGSEIKRLPLSADTEYVIKSGGGENTLLIEEGKAKMISADCPDKVCVEHVPIYRQNESIICLPHKVVVEIENGENNDIDIIAG